MKMEALFFLNNNLRSSVNFSFHPLEVVSRYRDPQLQVGENSKHYVLI